MSSATQAVVFNAVPLFVLAASYAAVAGSVLPTLWRMRGRAHLADWGLALVFPAVSIAAAIFGVLVVREERPVGGHVWLSFVAILVALIPAALLLMRGRSGPRSRPAWAGRSPRRSGSRCATASSRR